MRFFSISMLIAHSSVRKNYFRRKNQSIPLEPTMAMYNHTHETFAGDGPGTRMGRDWRAGGKWVERYERTDKWTGNLRMLWAGAIRDNSPYPYEFDVAIFWRMLDAIRARCWAVQLLLADMNTTANGSFARTAKLSQTIGTLLLLFLFALGFSARAQSKDVLTYHNDNGRTGQYTNE